MFILFRPLSSIYKKIACNTQLFHELLDVSETHASFSSLDTLGDAPWSTQQSSYAVTAIHSLVPGVFIAGTQEIIYFQISDTTPRSVVELLDH